ncbi:hypothetical protein H5410_042280 [Solanum commersonii]|uniref:FBD domain-containing protein n=1 Tax=Solanum commersonii TaxID=4109 RepID=A0A9J5XY30_SOLCO|nr:hypothetical protein H5410_042280 [Solanum commersonii]
MSVPVSLDFMFHENPSYSGPPKKGMRDFVISTHRDLHYWRSCQKIRKFKLIVDFPRTESYTYLTDDVMEKILSGCPNLECLKFYHFFGFRRLEIRNVKSRKLVIENLNHDDERDVWFEIIAPYIQNLKILGSCHGISLRNVPSLVPAVLNFDFNFTFEEGEEEDPLQRKRKESTCLRNFFTVLPMSRSLNWVPGASSLLQSSSDLKTLVMDGYKESRAQLLSYTNKDEQINRFETHNFSGSFPHLKTIKILNFSGSMLPFVKYLLKHASVLEKIVIVARSKRTDVSPDYVKMEKEFLSFPRSSPQASVTFSYR